MFYALVVAYPLLSLSNFLKPILILCRGDLFLYGTETMICQIKRQGDGRGLGRPRGAWSFFLSNFFPFEPFSFFSDKSGTSQLLLSIIKGKKELLGTSGIARALHDMELHCMSWCVVALNGMTLHGIARNCVVRNGIVCHDVAWRCMVWLWHGVV